MIEHREETLPKWARERLNSLRQEKEHLETLRQIHAVLSEGHDWFVISGPVEADKGRETYRLWLLDRDNPTCVCSLYRGDRLFIGRAQR